MNEKLLTTQGRTKEKVPASGRPDKFLSLHQLEHGKLSLDDQSYCVRFAEPKEWAGLRKQVEARRDTLPGYSYWQCLNLNCKWAAKMRGDVQEPVTCLKCNAARYAEGSWMKRMDKKEAEAFDKAESERARREIEQITLMAFNRRNEELRLEGRTPLTREQFDKGREAAYRFEQEQREAATKSFHDRKEAQELKEAEELKVKA